MPWNTHNGCCFFMYLQSAPPRHSDMQGTTQETGNLLNQEHTTMTKLSMSEAYRGQQTFPLVHNIRDPQHTSTKVDRHRHKINYKLLGTRAPLRHPHSHHIIYRNIKTLISKQTTNNAKDITTNTTMWPVYIPGGQKNPEQSIFQDFALINSYLFSPCWIEHLFLIITRIELNLVEINDSFGRP